MAKEPRRRSRRRQAPREAHRIGLVSDTHGRFDPGLPAVLEGVEEILHAGDVGRPGILDQLRELAPVYAVRGNVDLGVPGLELPSFVVRDLYGLAILVTHYVGTPEHLLPPVAAAIEAEKPGLVLSGHTHLPRIERSRGILFVNPGSCGPRRFERPVSCGVLTIREPGAERESPEIHWRLHDLESGEELDWTEA